MGVGGRVCAHQALGRMPAASPWELVWTSPVHAHYGGPYTVWLYTSPGIKPGFKKKKKIRTWKLC